MKMKVCISPEIRLVLRSLSVDFNLIPLIEEKNQNQMYMFGNPTDKFIDFEVYQQCTLCCLCCICVHSGFSMYNLEMVHKIKIIVLTKENTLDFSMRFIVDRIQG